MASSDHSEPLDDGGGYHPPRRLDEADDIGAARHPVALIEPPPFYVDVEPAPTRRRNASRLVSLGLAAAFGAVVGAFVPGLVAPAPSVAEDEARAPLHDSVETLAGELAALKAAIAASHRDDDAELAALADRFTRVEKAQDGLGAKIEELAATRRPPPSPEITGSVTRVAELPVAEGWIVWRVTKGRAVIEHRGRYYEVEPGSDVPGLGMVEAIDRDGGRWAVTTAGGVIMGPRG